MLEAFRKLAQKKLFKLLMGVLILAFMLTGVSAGFMAGVGDNYIVKVNDEKIYPGHLDRKFNMIVGSMVANSQTIGQAELELLARQKPQILEGMIMEAMIRHEARDLGVTVGDETVKGEISRTFTDKEGEFNEDSLKSFLYKMGMREKEFVEQIRAEIANELLLEALFQKNPVNDYLENQQIQKISEQRDLLVVNIPATFKKVSDEPTEKNLKDFYFENSYQFEIPEYKKISYLTIPKAEEGKEEEVYNLTVHIEDDLAAGATMDEIAEKNNLQLEVIEQFDEDNSTKSEKFLEVASLSEENIPSSVTEDVDGNYFVLNVDEVTESRIPEIDEIKPQLASAWKIQNQIEKTREFATKLYKEASKGGKLKSVANNYGLQTKLFKDVKQRDFAKYGPFVLDSFSAPKNDIIGVFEGLNGGFEIVKIVDIKTTELSEIDRETVRSQIRQNMNNELLEQYLQYLQTKHPVTQNPNVEANQSANLAIE